MQGTCPETSYLKAPTPSFKMNKKLEEVSLLSMGEVKHLEEACASRSNTQSNLRKHDFKNEKGG